LFSAKAILIAFRCVAHLYCKTFFHISDQFSFLLIIFNNLKNIAKDKQYKHSADASMLVANQN